MRSSRYRTASALTCARRATAERVRHRSGMANSPSPSSALWALVLAGGDGTRLQSLTRLIAGAPIPKQYCRLMGERSLLEETLARIKSLVPRARTLAIVNRDHLPLATPQLAGPPRRQPRRATAKP